MLSWWWGRYCLHNTLPVVFFDFGMSKRAKKWCTNRGKVVEMPSFSPPIRKEAVSEERLKTWMVHHDERMWVARPSWFKKPRAMMLSPFEKTVWLDLDCEVLGDLKALFSYGPVAAAKDIHNDNYDAGVLVFEKGTPIIAKWADLCEEKSSEFAGDADVLNFLVQDKAIQTLPQIYNWRSQLGENPDVVIIHWLGSFGKEIIHLLATAQP